MPRFLSHGYFTAPKVILSDAPLLSQIHSLHTARVLAKNIRQHIGCCAESLSVTPYHV